MTKERALEILEELSRSGDYEMAHSEADDVLCELLVSLGHQDVVDLWVKVGKWYA